MDSPSATSAWSAAPFVLRALLTAALTAAFLAIAHVLALGMAMARPNVVVIQTDDQPMEEVGTTYRDYFNRDQPVMPNTDGLIRDRGIQFTDYMVSFPICAPSRATLWSGQYAHNHGVIRVGGPRGGWEGYKKQPIMNQNLATWLARSGYQTAHVGKFINNYGGIDANPEKQVPPGWSNWISDATDNSTREFYGYTYNQNGQIVEGNGYPYYEFGSGVDPVGCPFAAAPCHYHSDMISNRAVDVINGSSPSQPFFLQVDYHTPHGDSRPPIGPEPAPRHYDTAIRTPLPRTPSFNEANFRDKPLYLKQGAKKMRPGEIRAAQIEYQKSLEALRSVDEGVGWIVRALRAKGVLKNTYVIFTSDNGFFLGEHRLSRGKLLPYDEALKVPMFIRGPGIKPGSTSEELVANIDLAPTILDLTGAKADFFRDGRTMRRFWEKPGVLSRRPILLEAYQAQTQLIPGDFPTVARVSGGKRASISAKAEAQNYLGLRIGPYKYVEYEIGQKELYDLERDPDELQNKIRNPRYAEVVTYMDQALDRYRGCVAKQCRRVTGAWPVPGG